MLSLSHGSTGSPGSVCTRAGITTVHSRKPYRNAAPSSSTTRGATPRSLVVTAATYHLGHVVYPSKKEAVSTFIRMKQEFKPRGPAKPAWCGYSASGEEIHPGHPDFEALWYLWHHHPDAGHPGLADIAITHFSVKLYILDDTKFKYTMFCTHFADQIRTDHCSLEGHNTCTYPFSYKACLDNKQHSQTTKNGGWAGAVAPKSLAELARANKEAAAFAAVLREQQLQHKQLQPDSYYYDRMRFEVGDQVYAFKEDYFDGAGRNGREFTCPINGSRVKYDYECQVDHHDPPFAVLAQQWLQQEGMTLADISTWTWSQKVTWVAYHDTHANLRLVSKHGNLSKAVEDKKAVAAVRRRRRSALPSNP